MAPRMFFLAVLGLASAAVLRSAEPDEPTAAGKKASEWLRLLEDSKASKNQRRGAVLALGIIGPKVPDIVPALIKTLQNDSEAEVRRQAANVLGQFGAIDDQPTVEALVAMLRNDADELARAVAATALGRMGSAGHEAVPALAEAASAKRLEVRQAAVGALGRLDPDTRTFAALHRALKDPDSRVRASAAFAVSRLSASARPAVADLGQMLLDDRAEEVRRAAAEGLARLGPEAKTALPSLVKALGDKDVDMRRQVALALSKLGPDAKTALPVLKEALADPDRFVRCHAIRALGGLVKEEPAVIGLLAACLKQDTVDVRLAALEELGQCGALAKAAEGAIKGALTDNRAVVREAAAEALKKIQAGP